MQRPKRLSQGFIRAVTEPGRYGDGRGGYGLSLVVKPLLDGSGLGKRFAQQIWRADRTTVNLGLGSAHAKSLAQARQEAFENAKRVRAGEPVREPRASLAKAAPTFARAAEAYLDLNRANWKGDSNERLVRQRLELHMKPLLDKPVDAITQQDLLALLGKMPSIQTRDRCLKVLRAIIALAVAREWRADNPADAVRGALPTARKAPRHHDAVAATEIAGVLARLDDHAGLWPPTANALRFVALTACRSGEVLGARWAEVDLDARTWTIPSDRMKSERPHTVPLSGPALAVLRRAADQADGSGLVFPSTLGKQQDGARLSEAMRACAGGTVHGLRASFRTWAADQGIERDVAEMVLAHAVGSATELAYKRTDYLLRRVAVMERWAAVVEGRAPQAEVLPFRCRERVATDTPTPSTKRTPRPAGRGVLAWSRFIYCVNLRNPPRRGRRRRCREPNSRLK